MLATVCGATVEPLGYVAAGAVVSEGQTVPSRELWSGNPARFRRKITEVCNYVHQSPSFCISVVRIYGTHDLCY